MRQQPADERAESFERVRPILHTIADEILGSAAQADDVLLGTRQQWMTTDLRDVDDVQSHLAALVARQALEALCLDAER